MKKVKEFFKSIQYKKLFKHIGLSILVVYVILSLGHFIFDTYSLTIDSDTKLEIFENHLKQTEEDIVYTYKTDRIENPVPGKLSYLEEKYPNAMYLENQIIGLTGRHIDILKESLFFGLLIGITIYMYKNSIKLSKLILGYILLAIIILIANEIMVSLPNIGGLEIDGSIIGGSEGWNCDAPILYFTMLSIILVIIKFKKNIDTSKKLNELIKK